MTKKYFTMLCALLLGCFVGVSAQIPLAGSTKESPVSLQIGEVYLLPTDFSTAYFIYQAEADGVLYLDLSSSLQLFAANQTTGGSSNPVPQFGTQAVQGIRAGETYLFHNASTWGNTVTMQVSFVPGVPYLPIKVESVSPEEGSVYHTATKEGAVTFEFNVPVNAAAIEASIVTAGGVAQTVNDYVAAENYTTRGTIYTLKPASAYTALRESGKLQEGEAFQIKLTNVADKNYPANALTDGVSVSYTAAPDVVTLTGIDKEGTLNAYYLEGDEAGLVRVTFSGNVQCNAESAILSYGDREKGTWAEIPVPYTVDGNTITLNLQGILLNKAPLDDDGKRVVNLSLKGICDTAGYYIEGNAVGSSGAVTFSFEVANVEVNVYCDFKPQKGANIDNTEELEIWIAEGKYITFDGAKLTYTKNGETVEQLLTKEELRITDDPYSEKDLLVYVPLTNCFPDAGELKVELTGVLAANGTSPAIEGTFLTNGKTDPDGIRPVRPATPTDNAPLYDLQGRRHQGTPSQGIYIREGKKVVIGE